MRNSIHEQCNSKLVQHQPPPPGLKPAPQNSPSLFCQGCSCCPRKQFYSGPSGEFDVIRQVKTEPELLHRCRQHCPDASAAGWSLDVGQPLSSWEKRVHAKRHTLRKVSMCVVWGVQTSLSGSDAVYIRHCHKQPRRARHQPGPALGANSCSFACSSSASSVISSSPTSPRPAASKSDRQSTASPNSLLNVRGDDPNAADSPTSLLRRRSSSAALRCFFMASCVLRHSGTPSCAYAETHPCMHDGEHERCPNRRLMEARRIAGCMRATLSCSQRVHNSSH